MKYKATYRHARISPRKVRPLADMVRGLSAPAALEVLRFQPHRGARMLEKVIQSAIGNSQDPDNPANRSHTYSPGDLYVVDARVDGGPMFKRVRPRARGMAFMIRKRFSHIHVILSPLPQD